MAIRTKPAAAFAALVTTGAFAIAAAFVFTGAFADPVQAEDAAGAEVDVEQLYQLCAQCHGAEGQGNKLYLAPAIAGLDEWYVQMQLMSFRNGLRGLHFDDIAGMRMRPMSMTLADNEIAAVAAHVARMPKTQPDITLDGDVDAGKTLYTLCAACHGPTAQGIAPMKAPPLANLNDWYLVEQLVKFKMGIRGTRPGDPYGVLMGPNSPMAMTLKTDQSVRDVVAYIMTLRDSQQASN